MRLKTIKMTSYILLGVFCVFMLVMGITRVPLWGYLAIGAAAVSVGFNIAFWRCPHCGKRLGRLEAAGGGANYCPFCGEKIEF